MKDVIRVLLVDDHALFRLGLRTLLGEARDVDVVAEAEDGMQALAMCERLHPDVVIMDLAMRGMGGLDATRQIVERFPECRVLILTMHDEEEFLIPLLESGAVGYMVKSAAGRELLDALRAVAAGDVYVRPAAARVLAKGWTRRGARGEPDARWSALSERERNVLLLFAQGHSLAQIGERLGISPKTVDTYRRRITDKIGLAERTEFVTLALELGLLETAKG